MSVLRTCHQSFLKKGWLLYKQIKLFIETSPRHSRSCVFVTCCFSCDNVEVACEPTGGYFVWARLPRACPIGATALLARCASDAAKAEAFTAAKAKAAAKADEANEDSGGSGESDSWSGGVMFLPGPRCRPEERPEMPAPRDAGPAPHTRLSADQHGTTTTTTTTTTNGSISGSSGGSGGGGHASGDDVASLDRWVRLCFAWLPEATLLEGARRLMHAVAQATAEAAAETAV